MSEYAERFMSRDYHRYGRIANRPLEEIQRKVSEAAWDGIKHLPVVRKGYRHSNNVANVEYREAERAIWLFALNGVPTYGMALVLWCAEIALGHLLRHTLEKIRSIKP